MSLTAIILAGRKSTRMGQDKAFIQWKGKSFLEHIINTAKQLTDNVVLSGDMQRLAQFGLEVIEDQEYGNGPVYGLASCFGKVKTDNVLVLSCDVPQISAIDLEYLVSHHTEELDVTCFEYQGKVMPLIGIYNSSAFKAFKRAMKNEQRRLFSVLDGLKVKTIKYKGADGLMNINCPEDLKALL